MRTFNKGRKVNFVDGNNVLVGFDDESCCCENFGFTMEVGGIKIHDGAL